MKQLTVIACLLSIFACLPAYGSNKFVIDFRDGHSISRGTPVDLIKLIERRTTGYTGQRITDVSVYTSSRNRRYGGYVQLLDDNRRLISEDSLSNGFASLHVYEDHQWPAFLYFNNDVYLQRIEVITERRPRYPEQKRALKQKEIRIPKKPLQIGNFLKADYTSEVKKFSIPSGGFSKINFRVRVGEQHAVIVNSILVLSNGSKLGWKTIGTRLSHGDNEYPLDVPKEATDIQVSFAHGKGSAVQVFLLP